MLWVLRMKDIQALQCANALKSVMKYREVTIPVLAVSIGVSERTLQEYTSGKVSLANAKARTVILIAQELKVDPLILIGEKPIEDFYQKERKRGRKTLNWLHERNCKKVRGR